jgi:hypothetical protein
LRISPPRKLQPKKAAADKAAADKAAADLAAADPAAVALKEREAALAQADGNLALLLEEQDDAQAELTALAERFRAARAKAEHTAAELTLAKQKAAWEKRKLEVQQQRAAQGNSGQVQGSPNVQGGQGGGPGANQNGATGQGQWGNRSAPPGFAGAPQYGQQNQGGVASPQFPADNSHLQFTQQPPSNIDLNNLPPGMMKFLMDMASSGQFGPVPRVTAPVPATGYSLPYQDPNFGRIPNPPVNPLFRGIPGMSNPGGDQGAGGSGSLPPPPTQSLHPDWANYVDPNANTSVSLTNPSQPPRRNPELPPGYGEPGGDQHVHGHANLNGNQTGHPPMVIKWQP